MTEVNQLSNREREVLNQLLKGKSNKLIAASLGISKRTVEFHLKNIYAKFQVSSRIELILKLGNATGNVEIEKLGSSTVESPGESTENGGRHNPWIDWTTSFRETVSIISKESEMKNLLNTKHVPAGVITALFAGSLWVLALRNVGNMSLHDIQTWILPLILIWGMIGSLVGLIGRRNGNTLLKVGFSTLFGTGLSPIAILPIMVMVVLPVGKFADAIGLINRTTISSDVATTLVITAMMTIWLVLGIALGILLLYLTIKKPEQNVSQMPAPEHPL